MYKNNTYDKLRDVLQRRRHLLDVSTVRRQLVQACCGRNEDAEGVLEEKK